jgi:hypothetical protein
MARELFEEFNLFNTGIPKQRTEESLSITNDLMIV